MGFENSNTQGSKNTNAQWQRAVLVLLEAVASGTGGAGQLRNSTLTRYSSAGIIPSGAKSVSFFNAGAISATVLSNSLKPGEQVSFSVISNADFLGSYSFDATGTELLITTLT